MNSFYREKVMKKKTSAATAEIYLVNAGPFPELFLTEGGRLTREEVRYADARLANEKLHTFFPLPVPHFICFAPDRKTLTFEERLEKIRTTAADVVATLRAEKCCEAEIIDTTWQNDEDVLAFMEGIHLADYRFDEFRNKKEKPIGFSLHSITVRADKVARMEALCAEVKRARRLIDLPFSSLNAAQLAGAAKEGASKTGIKVDVWSEARLRQSGMGGLLGVNQGSKDKPSFTEMEYRPAKAVNKKPILLVGKGIVFDAGGMNIKTGNYMDEMKTDMAGAAVVMGVVRAVAALGLPVYVKALLPATDNRLNGNAMVCGDILNMYDGTTVEIVNTDAEGRLILADAVAYGCRNFDPELVVTVATLTGAASRALGSQGIAAMQENADLYTEPLMKAGAWTHERLCFFPMWKEYEKDLTSKVADLKNCGNGPAGMITAAKFIKHFAGECPFVHLDVAGVEYLSKRDGYRGPGATAYGLRLLVEFLRDYAEKGGSQKPRPSKK